MTLFFVGCYTQVLGHVPNGCGEGIYAYDLEQESGNLRRKAVIGNNNDVNNPSYVHYNETTQELYAVEEVEGSNDDDSPPQASLITYRVTTSGEGGEPVVTAEEISRDETKASALCHVCTASDDNRYVILAAYGSGSIVLKDKNTSALKTYAYSGSGPNRERQESPHIHQTVVSPDGKYLYNCDLGSDKVWCHSTSHLPNFLPQEDIHRISVPPGYGPRHMVFHPLFPNRVYVLCELSGMLLSYLYDSNTGHWSDMEEVNSLPQGYNGGPTKTNPLPAKASAAIRIHPTSNAIFVSNRFHDSIGIFPLNKADGKILGDRITWVSCRGKTPRDFAISGRWLIVANQDDDTLTVFEIISNDDDDSDETNCVIKLDYQKTYPCKTPSCIAFSS